MPVSIFFSISGLRLNARVQNVDVPTSSRLDIVREVDFDLSTLGVFSFFLSFLLLLSLK